MEISQRTIKLTKETTKEEILAFLGKMKNFGVMFAEKRDVSFTIFELRNGCYDLWDASEAHWNDFGKKLLQEVEPEQLSEYLFAFDCEKAKQQPELDIARD